MAILKKLFKYFITYISALSAYYNIIMTLFKLYVKHIRPDFKYF